MLSINIQNFCEIGDEIFVDRFYGQKTNLVEQNVCETIRNTSLAANPKLDMSPFSFSIHDSMTPFFVSIIVIIIIIIVVVVIIIVIS